MNVFEITGFVTGVSKEGVNFLLPSDTFQNIENGYINRQVLQSRQGAGFFAPRLADQSRIFGIFEHIHPDGTKELLVVDQNFLYRYNGVTNAFDQIPFGGSMLGYAGFAISAKDFYVSGTSYPTPTNGQRFVFTGEGIAPNGAGSSIFFYDGTNVLDFTSLVDNPNFAQYIGGPLTKSVYVLWFNERLNFVVPFIGGIEFSQGVLYSGIRTVSGNGDKFNVAGSGLLQADTYEPITGCTIIGQVIGLNFLRSNWTLEKTKDAFNPYFIRKVPSVIGTDAKFSSVSWNDIDISLGKTGIIGTDGRKSLRVDNKIPNFTAEEMDQVKFNLTYGGFDRINNQFLWSFKHSEDATDTQNQVLVCNYDERSWSLNDQRFSVFGQTDLGQDLVWDDIDETQGNVSWKTWDTTEEIWDRIGLGLSVQKTLAGDDLGFIYDINQDYDDYTTNIIGITQASQAVLTVGQSAFQVGDRVAVYGVEGMTEINNDNPSDNTIIGDIYEIVAATDTLITLDVDSTLFTAATPNTGNIAKVISFRAETVPFNPFREQGRRCYIGYIEFLIDTNGGFLYVDIVADEEESPFIDNVLLKPDTTLKGRQWISISVNNEADFHTIIMRQENPSTQVRITSIRIHASPGGLTSG